MKPCDHEEMLTRIGEMEKAGGVKYDQIVGIFGEPNCVVRADEDWFACYHTNKGRLWFMFHHDDLIRMPRLLRIPEHLEGRREIAEAYYNDIDRQDEAYMHINEFLQITRIDPTYAKAYYALAVAAEELGNYDEAVRYLRLAVRHSPDDMYYRESLEEAVEEARHQRKKDEILDKYTKYRASN